MLKKLSIMIFSLLIILAVASCVTTQSTSKIIVSFNSNGGSEVENIELDEEGTIIKPIDPTKEGYTFEGWYLEDELFDFDNYVVNESITLDAKWNKIQNQKTYIIKLYLNGGVCEVEEIEFSDCNEVVLPTPTKEGYTFAGWSIGSSIIVGITENKNYILNANWIESIPMYHLNLFWVEEGTKVDYQDVEFSDYNEVELPVPTREGYIFKGWYENEVLVEIIEENRNYDLEAKWEAEVILPTEYLISLRPAGGTIPSSSIKFTNYEEVELPIPTREGYIFLGWFESNTPIESITENRNYTLVAKWQGEVKTITYVLDGGTFEGDYPTEHTVGTSTILVNPIKEGFKFLGWYKNADFSDSAVTRIAGSNKVDVTLYAKWEVQLPVVTYTLNGGNWKYANREAMVEDFLKDAMEWGGVTSKPDGMVRGAGDTQTGFANVFGTKFYGFFSDARYEEKWAWLKEYIINVTSNSTSKSNLQSGSEPFWRYSVGAFIFEEYRSSYPISEDFTKDAAANGFWETLSTHEQTEFEADGAPLTPIRLYYIFDGWYDNAEFSGEKITNITKSVNLYAKWIEEVPVDSISITNKITEIDRFETHQLTWALNPNNAAIKSVEFTSSDPEIATVDENGLVTALQNGTVTITIRSLSPSRVTDTMTIYISSPAHFDVSYETTSYVTLNGEVKLNALYINRDGSKPALIWESMTPSIATVNASGLVTGLTEGDATIRVSLESDSTIYFEFIVSVLPANLVAELQYVVDGHESNVFTRYDLGIGAGTPVYYTDVLGSVNDAMFNYDMTYNTKHLAACMANGQWSSGLTKVEFITVHYTAGMTEGSNAEATAIFFSGNKDASAHFCTGNDGVFQTLDLDVKGWHAGDGANTEFTWNPTGVMYSENDPKWPTWGISGNAKFTINGQETSIKVPYKDQRGSEGYVTDDKWLNDQGFAFKIVNGEYYMGTTWWCYSNVWEGRICSRGGNKHSIGIESAVDFGSDLWYTWQITAQLVADLMVKYNLDITRVYGHHFFAAKDCPQPLLENDMEIWWKFIEMVEAEYEALTTHKNTEFEFSVVKGNDVINEYGRVIDQPEYSQVVSYKVTTSNGKSITLSSIVPGIYTK